MKKLSDMEIKLCWIQEIRFDLFDVPIGPGGIHLQNEIHCMQVRMCFTSYHLTLSPVLILREYRNK